MVHAILKRTIIPFIRLFIRKIGGGKNIPEKCAFIVAANHASFFDDFVVPSILIPVVDKKLHFYVKLKYFENYIIRKILEDVGEEIPVASKTDKDHDKINKKAFDTALSYLKKGGVVGIFPEGTRSFDGKLQRAKTGIAKVALTAKVPVLPIGIVGSDKILPKGSFLPRIRRCEVNVGKPLYFEKYYGKSQSNDLLENITRDIMKEIAMLSNQKYNF